MADDTNPQIEIKRTIQTIAVMSVYRREGVVLNRGVSLKREEESQVQGL